jgi:hypothetical protein
LPAWKALTPEERRSERARLDLAFLTEEILGYRNSRHHREWYDLMQRHRRLAVAAPRDHAKSTCFSENYPLWRVFRYDPRREPFKRVYGYLFSDTVGQAQDLLEEVERRLRETPALHFLIPADRKLLVEGELRFANGANLVAAGMHTAVRGGHAQFVICDDVLNDESCATHLQREKAKKYFRKTISPMVARGGSLFLVGTVQHHQDLLMDLIGNPEFTGRRYQALQDDSVLWPEVWPRERLEAKRREIGSVAFASEYQNEPVDETTALFRYEWLQQCFDPALRLVADGAGLPAAWKRYGAADLAVVSSKRRAEEMDTDYFVCGVLAVDELGNRHLVHLYRDRGLSPAAQAAKIAETCRAFDCRLFLVENNAAQDWLVGALRETTALPIRPYTTGREKADLYTGVPSLSVLFENRKFRIPRGDERSVALTDILVAELNGLRREAHDDTVMWLWLANEAAKQGSADLPFYAGAGVGRSL